MEATCHKIETYKKEKDSLQKDSDGIYIIVEGLAKLYNKKDKDERLQLIKKLEYFGESKFISQQGYSYFGVVEACGIEESKELKEINVKKRGTTKDGIEDKIVTTCLFLPSIKFYLIPFYDLMRLRENKKAKARVRELRKTC
jgi:hypothetical protein